MLAPYQNGISKIANLLDRTFDNKDLPRFVTQKWIEVMINQEIKLPC